MSPNPSDSKRSTWPSRPLRALRWRRSLTRRISRAARDRGRLSNWRASATLFRRAVENFTEDLLVPDLDDRILHANNHIAELTGDSREQMIGQKAYEPFLDPEHWPDLQKRNEMRGQGVSEQYEVHVRRKDGSHFWGRIPWGPTATRQHATGAPGYRPHRDRLRSNPTRSSTPRHGGGPTQHRADQARPPPSPYT
ncbi:MAG TPA: PAS domain S-box protein [Candidatus Latescibacteria bacterium]|nr:PAS domain S-box protein [Candidatus Handelsmanbacteria bacterium]HIL09577.1 PAS domain S-box protein [Candidatus Latescibacterota bacterium]